MVRTIRARFSGGVVKLLEIVNIAEGADIKIRILEASSNPEGKSFLDSPEESFGGWKDLIDCDDLKRNIYADRLMSMGFEGGR